MKPFFAFLLLATTAFGQVPSPFKTTGTTIAPVRSGDYLRMPSGDLRIRSSGAAFDLKLGTSEVLSADRQLSITVGNAARALSLSGDLTTGGAFTTSGASALTLTTTGATNVTLPTSGTIYGTATGSITSANLLGSLSDETGTGAAVFAESPTFVTPALGTPASGVVTNLTGTASININGTVGATTPAAGTFTTLSSTGNTTIGDAAGDTLTLNAAAWTAPSAIVQTTTAVNMTAETLQEWKVSDDSGASFLVKNSTANNSTFAPLFEGVIAQTGTATALSFFGTKGADSTTNPAILFLGRYNNGGGNTDIGLTTALAEFRNRATSLVYIYGNGDLKLVRSGAALGYGTGAGGTVTQGTDKSTTVVLSKACGAITMHNATLNAGTTVSFTLTNTVIAATDVLVLNHISGGTIGAYTLNAQCGGGSATINVRNISAGNLGEAIVIQFAVIKGVNS